MKLTLVSYNDEDINDGSDYNAFFSGDMEVQGGSSIVELQRAGRRPVYATKVLQGKIIKLYIYMLGDVASQIDELNTIFDVEEMDPKVLIAKDETETQWYVNAVTKSVPKVQGRILTVELSASDPAWRTVETTSDVWAITASGQDNAIEVDGNLPAYPIYKFKPTAAGGNRFAYSRLAIFRNRVAAALTNYPLQILSSWDTEALISDATNHVHINDVAGIDDDDETIPYNDEAGTFPTSGLAYLGTEQIYYTGKTETHLTGVVRGVNGTTAAAHADDVQINQSHIQADGDDIRVYVNGEEIDRWLVGVNTSSTAIWINLSMAAGRGLTTSAAISGSGAVSTITFAGTTANKNNIKALPTKGEVYIDSELFGYTGKKNTKRQLTGVTRAIKGTSAAAHSKGATAYWIQHEIYIYYGNVEIEAPDTDDDYKPCLNLATSTNASWVYDKFGNEVFKRTGRFTPSLVSSLNKIDLTNQSGYYTDDAFADADPFNEMGMAIRSWQSGTTWKAETATVQWHFYNPCLITHVTCTGEKYRYASSFPTARCQKSKDNSTWSTVWTDTSPGSAQTWTALAEHAAVALGSGYKYIRFRFYGSLASSANNSAGYEIDSLALALNSSYVPTGTVLGEESTYYLNATLYNNTTGESFNVYAGMELNDTLEVNTLTKTARLVGDDKPINTVKLSTVRRDWLKLLPGTNTLLFEDEGTAGLTLTTTYEDRNT